MRLQHCKSAGQSDAQLERRGRKKIRIGASTIPSAYILPEILPAFRAIRPATQFHVFQSDSQGIVDGLMCGAFDMGLIGVEVHEEMLELTPFYADQMVLITPVNEHFLRFRDAGGMTLADICREPMLLREKGSGSKNACPLILSGWVWTKTT